ncbi:hypothetical protein PIB30_051878 [Stylosanthes scabra]|uniref:RNase H type-1 domain-containing protein n=1 Tax=Stylosanthes scabra TaxID=79078 RepID=A0ABU6TIK6_9FABA|nr:hypothetical protein [Stylosanthes scabra]
MLELDFIASKQTNQNQISNRHSKPQRKATWNPPPMGWTKLNVDAAFLRSSGSGFAAVICKDSSKRPLAVSSSSRLVSSPLAGEAHALREAVIMANNFNMNKAIKSNTTIPEIDAFLMDIWELSKNLPDRGFIWVPREANSVAHDLVKFVAAAPSCSTSIHNLPDTIRKSIISKAKRIENRRISN